jgi:hypothetical protein
VTDLNADHGKVVLITYYEHRIARSTPGGPTDLIKPNGGRLEGHIGGRFFGKVRPASNGQLQGSKEGTELARVEGSG